MVWGGSIACQVYYDAAQEFANQNGLFFYEAWGALNLLALWAFK